VNKSDMIEHIAKSADISKAAAERALDATVASIKTALKKGAQESHARAYRVRDVEVRWRDGDVRARAVQRLGAIVLVERDLPDPDPALVAAAVADGLRADGLRLLRWTPGALDLRARLVTVYLAGGMNAEAIAEYEALADAALARKDYENAEAICRRILAIDRNRADIAAHHDGHKAAADVLAADQLDVEMQQVADERRLIGQQVRQPQVAGGPVAAQADQEQRHGLAAGILRRFEQRLAVGRHAIGQKNDRGRRPAALGFEHVAQAVAQPAGGLFGLGLANANKECLFFYAVRIGNVQSFCHRA